jgi:putative ABC transport system permease protein
MGVGGTLALMRVLESELFGVRASDPMTFASVIIVLGTTALMASLAPAWRGARRKPGRPEAVPR